MSGMKNKPARLSLSIISDAARGEGLAGGSEVLCKVLSLERTLVAILAFLVNNGKASALTIKEHFVDPTYVF